MAEESFAELIDRINREQNPPPPKVDGLPEFTVSHYKLTLPPSLNDVGSLAYSNPELRYDFGPIHCWFAEHEGGPIRMSDSATLNAGDRYLDISLPNDEGQPLGELMRKLRDLTAFVEQYPKIDWLFGSSWLASVNDGRLIGRYGFHVSDIEVPPGVAESSLSKAVSKPNAGTRYLETVDRSTVKFFYASRDDFLKANGRV